MNLWSSLAAAFVGGFGAGATFAFIRLKLKLNFYRHFIEERLSRWTDQHVPGSMPAEVVCTGPFDAPLVPGPVRMRERGFSGRNMKEDLSFSRSLIKH